MNALIAFKIQFPENTFPRFRFIKTVIKRAVFLITSAAFILVHQHIRLRQNLRVRTVYTPVGMMMGGQPADAVNIFRLESESFQYRACFPRPQFLLYLSIIPAELHFAPMNPDIMDISGRFQNEKLFLRNPPSSRPICSAKA